MIDEIPVNVGLDLPDSVNPIFQLHILLDAPHEGHSRVGVHIDKGRHSRLSPAIHHFDIYDNGRGIPPQALEHLTEAFYRVDKSRSRAQGGVGLGLALCREIVALHNGTMEFTSTLGKGTCVTVELKGGRA